MLVIEGPDKVGKTTFAHFAHQIAGDVFEKHGIAAGCAFYSHFTKLPPQWDYYWSYLPSIRPMVVQDRFHMSEIAYGVSTRGETALSPEIYRLIDSKLRLMSSFVVLITADDDFLRKQFADRRQDRQEMFELDQVLRVNENYCNIAARQFRCPKTKQLYQCDVDFHWHMTCHDDCKFLSSSPEAKTVIESWAERVAQAVALEQRRPMWI